MIASSLSTYLDATKAAPPASAPSDASIDQAAKVVAAIHGGAHGLAEISAGTGIESPQVIMVLSALVTAGLVVLSGDGDNVSAVLTDAAEKTLASTA